MVLTLPDEVSPTPASTGNSLARATRSRGMKRALTVAAALLVAVLGLTAYASFLYGRLEEQRDRLAEQQERRTRLKARLQSLSH